MIYVFDSSAVIALFRDEPGYDRVENILYDDKNQCFIHAINLCEIYYDSFRHKSKEYAEMVVLDLLKAGVVSREDFDPTFWRKVGRLKAVHRASLADFCGAVLTDRLDGIFLTADHHEFDKLAAESICKVEFIR